MDRENSEEVADYPPFARGFPEVDGQLRSLLGLHPDTEQHDHSSLPKPSSFFDDKLPYPPLLDGGLGLGSKLMKNRQC